MTELQTSTVYRMLESKMKLFGMEMEDVLMILILAAVMNLLFGQTKLAMMLVFILPTVLGIGLYFLKRNRPPNFLRHYLRFYLMPGFFLAGDAGIFEVERSRKIYE